MPLSVDRQVAEGDVAGEGQGDVGAGGCGAVMVVADVGQKD